MPAHVDTQITRINVGLWALVAFVDAHDSLQLGVVVTRDMALEHVMTGRFVTARDAHMGLFFLARGTGRSAGGVRAVAYITLRQCRTIHIIGKEAGDTNFVFCGHGVREKRVSGTHVLVTLLLPMDLLEDHVKEIFSHLPLADLFRVCFVCKTWAVCAKRERYLRFKGIVYEVHESDRALHWIGTHTLGIAIAGYDIIAGLKDVTAYVPPVCVDIKHTIQVGKTTVTRSDSHLLFATRPGNVMDKLVHNVINLDLPAANYAVQEGGFFGAFGAYYTILDDKYAAIKAELALIDEIATILNILL